MAAARPLEQDPSRQAPHRAQRGGDTPRPPRRSRLRALGEFVAAAVTWGVWEWAEALGYKVVVFPVLLLAWISYFVVRGIRMPALWPSWGIRVHDWRHGLRWHAAATALALTFLGVLGAVHATFTVPREMWIVVALYPAWAFCQQFVLQNGVVANFRTLGVPRRWLPLLGMAAFASVHLPDLPLAGLTALGGLLWTWLWLRAPNLWLLALGHSIVGTAGFVWVLDRDPLANFPQVVRLAGWL